jgi:hypothetical protein
MHDDIAAAFEAGRERGARGNMIAAPAAHELGKKMVREANSSQDYLAAAEQLGFSYQLAETAIRAGLSAPGAAFDKRGYMGAQFDALDVLGSIYPRYPSIDGDMASIQGSKMMKRAARGYVEIGAMRSAAISYTNAAVALMEKDEVTGREFKQIKQLLDLSFQYKQPGTVDWGYLEAALGMYWAELGADSTSEYIVNLQKSKEANSRAIEIFEQHGEVVSIAAQSIVARVERNLYRTRKSEKVAKRLLEHIMDLPTAAQRWAPEIPNVIADNIGSNPATYGFDTVPAWLSEITDSPPSEADAETLQLARDRLLHAVKNDTSSDYTALLDCRWQAAEIDLDLLPAGQAYQNFLSLITTYADDFSPEEFIRRGSRIIRMARHVGENPPVQLLLDIAAAFERITEQRDAERLEVFLRKNPAHMRFVACELCEHGLWDEAISVIENSRLLLYAKHAQESRECDLPSTDPTEPNSWVYLIHNPVGTYVILGPEDDNGTATGVFLADINGADLSNLHFSFADEAVGLMHAQAGGMSGHLTSATARAFDILEPLAEAIRSLVPEGRGICLIIAGLYVTLPVSAALTREDPLRYLYVTVVPSRTHTVSRSYSLSLSEIVATAMSASIAPWVPDMPVLTCPDDEVMALGGLWSASDAQVSVVTDARVDDFGSAFEHGNLIHFSGHSMGMPFQPDFASMLFLDGPCSVSMILEQSSARSLLLATISSCQSGHQSTTVLADEFLGINTALLNRGCRFTLSTLWPILDVVSYIVTSRLYSELASEGVVNIKTLHRCLTDTQSWMRTSTAAEVIEFFETNNLNIPALLETFPAEFVPFAHPRVWAAYYLSSRSL